MENIIMILFAVIVVDVLMAIYQKIYYERRMSELLDRLMAKDLPEFNRLQLARGIKHSPRVLSTMNDEEMAENEKCKKALGLVAHVDTDMAGVGPKI